MKCLRKYRWVKLPRDYNSCNGILHMCTGQSKLLVEEASRLCVEGKCEILYL